MIDETKEKTKEAKPAMSPTEDGQSKSPDTMTIGAAMDEVRKGSKVRRLEWEDEKVYASMKDGLLKLFTIKDGQKEYGFHEWIISDGDIHGEDYSVV